MIKVIVKLEFCKFVKFSTLLIV